MHVAYVIVAVLTATFSFYAAYLNFVHHESVIEAAERVRVSTSMMVPFGLLLAAGGTGLVVGLAVPVLGTTAAIGLVLYFICAVSAHLRVGDRGFGGAAMFLTLAVATLVLGLVDRGVT